MICFSYIIVNTCIKVMMMVIIIIIIIIIIKLSCSDQCTFLSTFLQSLIFTPSSLYTLSLVSGCLMAVSLVSGWLMAVSFHVWENQNICRYYQKCPSFVTWKKPGYLASRTEFCGTPGPRSLKRRKPGPFQENYGEWNPYYHNAALIYFRPMKDVYV